MKKNYTVAICDILGFLNLVEKSSLDIIVNFHLGNLKKSLYHSIYKNDFPNEIPDLDDLQLQANLGIFWFSDSILLYTMADTDECIKNLTTTLGWLLFETNTNGNIHLRCGVSYGEAFIDDKNSIFVGQPIIDAYRLEQSQQWSGGALTNSVVQRLPEFIRNGDTPEWYLTRYNIPLKNNKTFNSLAIDWTFGIHQKNYKLKWSKSSPEPNEDDWQNSFDICEKWKNTNKFHDEICLFCNDE